MWKDDSPARQVVQLRHELPDGSWHIDLMIEDDPPGQGRLVTFRLAGSTADMTPGETIEIERIGDHRRAYLQYDGPLTDDRGHVTRIAHGSVLDWQRGARVWDLRIRWASPGSTGEQQLRLEQIAGDRWRLVSQDPGTR